MILKFFKRKIRAFKEAKFFALVQKGAAKEIDEELKKIKFPVLHVKNGDGRTPLMMAIIHNPHVDVVELLLRRHSDVNAQDNEGATPLILAGRFATNPRVVSLLLKYKADIEMQDNIKNTALVYCKNNEKIFKTNAYDELISAYEEKDFMKLIRKAPYAKVRRAIDNGASATQKNANGVSPLMVAVTYNPDEKVIALLIDNGAQVNERNEKGVTPLIAAARANTNAKVAAVLIEKGANIGDRDELGASPLLAAAKNPNADMTRLLLEKGADINDRNRDGSALMIAAAFNPTPEVVDALVEAGANVNEQDSMGKTPLIAAAISTKNPAVVEALLAQGADKKMTDKAKTAAAEYAAKNDALKETDAYWRLSLAEDNFVLLMQKGSYKEIESAIENGADVNEHDKNGLPAIICAAAHNKDERVVSLLIEKGANKDEIDSYGRTPLMAAAQSNPNPKVIEALLKAGADAKIRDKTGNIALEYTKENPHVYKTDVYWMLNNVSY